MNNVIGGGFFTPMFSGADRARQGWLMASVWCVAAVVTVIAAGAVHLSRRYPRQTLTLSEEGSRPGAASGTVVQRRLPALTERHANDR